MTEGEWMASNDQVELLVWAERRTTARKLRLFATAARRTLLLADWPESAESVSEYSRNWERAADSGETVDWDGCGTFRTTRLFGSPTRQRGKSLGSPTRQRGKMGVRQRTVTFPRLRYPIPSLFSSHS